MPAAENLDHVANRGAVERRDDADLAGKGGQCTFACLVEQPLGLQACPELVERELEGSEALRLEMIADQLILALRFVDGDLAACHDLQAIGGLELEVAQRRAEHEPAHLRRGVLQREVQMAGVPDLAVRQLAFDPDLEEFLFETIADLDREIGHADDAP